MTPPRVSAAGPLQAPLIAALKTDGTLAPLLNGDKVYSGRVPGRTTDRPPYIVLGSSAEDYAPVFGQAAMTNQVTLHIWTDSPDHEKVLLIFGHVARILGAPLTVPGFEAGPGGDTRLVAVMNDPATQNGHGVAVWERFHVAA